MDDSKELEKLIAKSRIQIEEREKLIKEMLEARELDDKRRALQQLTTETELLKGESSRLKAEIELTRSTLQQPQPAPRQNPYFDRRERTQEVMVPRESVRDRVAEQAKFNDALLEVTREIRAELARQREVSNQRVETPKAPEPVYRAPEAPAPRPYEAPTPAPTVNNEEARLLSKELKELRAELTRQGEAVKEATRLVRTTPVASRANPELDAERDQAIADLRREIRELERDVTRAHQVSIESANKEKEVQNEATNLFAETRKLRSEFDRQKVDNFKRDRDMTRVIDLLEKIADEDE